MRRRAAPSFWPLVGVLLIQALPSREDKRDTLRYGTIRCLLQSLCAGRWIEKYLSPKFSAVPSPEIARRSGSATDGSLRRGPVCSFIARLQSLNQAWGKKSDGLPKWQICPVRRRLHVLLLACDIGNMGCWDGKAIAEKEGR